MAGNKVDEGTMNILKNAMSVQAALNSMGYGMENDDFAKQMAERDAKAAMKPTNDLAGGVATATNQPKQKPISSRRKGRNMRKQAAPASETETIAPSMASADIVPNTGGLTADQMALINRVKDGITRAEEDYIAREEAAIADFATAEQAVVTEPAVEHAAQVDDEPYVPTSIRKAVTEPAATPRQSDNEGVVRQTASPSATYVPPEPPVTAKRNGITVQGTVDTKFVPGMPTPDFNAFVEITEWPSRGLAYNNRIYGQSLKLVDMYMLGYMDDNNSPSTLDTIIGRHVRGISPGDILSCDEVYLMHWLRASSYPKSGMFGPRYVCKECKFDVSKSEQADYTIGFRDLAFSTSSDPAEVIGMHAEHGHVKTYTYDDRECDIYLRRRHHDSDIVTGKREWEKLNNQPFPKYLNMFMTLAAVVEIEDCDGILQKMDYICEYPPAMREAFLDAIADASLSTTVKARVTCPSCGGVAEWPYPFRVKEFLSGI